MARWICSRTMSFPHMIAMALLLVRLIAFTGRVATAQNPVPMINLPKLRLTRHDSRSRDSHISLLALSLIHI